MGKGAEIVVVGGGIVGCATAYFLANDGVDVTIVEKGDVGGSASGYSAGLLNPLEGAGIPGPLEGLAEESFRMHRPLTQVVMDATGIDPQYRIRSGMWIAFTDAESEELEALYQTGQRKEGFTARWLEPPQHMRLEPRLSPQVTKAMVIEDLAEADSHGYTLALAKAAQRRGATIRIGTVDRLNHANGRVSGVSVDGEELACDKLVLAMGPWSGEAEKWLGVRVPIGPLKGQVLRLKMEGPPLRQTIHRSGGGYLSYKPDGLIWAGTTEEPVGFDELPTPAAQESILKSTIEILPCLTQARIALQTACLRPVSEDGLPVIGEVPGWEGVYIAGGGGRKGVLLAPAMARATADLVTTGRTGLPIEVFSPGRFTPSTCSDNAPHPRPLLQRERGDRRSG